MKKMTEEQKIEAKRIRDEAKREKNRADAIEAAKNQLPIERMNISIEWKRSRTWGANPHLIAEVWFKENNERHYERFTATCSGCGYDKASTVMADAFNHFLKYKLWQVDCQDREKVPYGINLYDNNRSFEGGVGMECYYGISEFLGGVLEQVARGETFTAYTFRFKD